MNAVIVYSVLCLVFIKQFSARVILADYNKERNNLLKRESTVSAGGRLRLNDEETIVNNILMRYKEKELNESFHNPHLFNFSKHYFSYKNEIEKSQVYQIIRRMPKGAALHVHASLMLGADYLLNLTYEDHLYACFAEGDLKLQFSDAVPKRPCLSNWALLSDLRNVSDDVDSFDSDLKKYFTLYSDDEHHIDSDINTIWKRFDKVYYTIKPLISYRPVREKFFYEALKKFYDDNIAYIEIRSGLHSLYELDGTIHDRMYTAKLYQQVTKKFIEEYPDFIGVKIILTRNRSANLTEIREALALARKLKSEMPDMFAGFDLVGQEDLGKPLSEFLPALLEVKDEIDFYFHGGETNWSGTSSDENLIDAVLLGSKRIGHAYALIKHPSILTEVMQKRIVLEVNVISNSILSLLRDIRNHPLATYLAMGLPVVLSSDDPGIWDADPLSHDFYVAFVGVASKHDDLRLLKQLAINALAFSALDDESKGRLAEVFLQKWNKFLNETIENYTLN